MTSRDVARIVVALFLLGGVAAGEEVDAPLRTYDLLTDGETGRTFEGTVADKGDATGRVKFRRRDGIETSFERAKVKILPRQTPEQAYAERAPAATTADQHTRLGEWCWKLGLKKEGARELARAEKTGASATDRAISRDRLVEMLVDLLLARLPDLPPDEQDGTHERLLAAYDRAAKDGGPSPWVSVGAARVLVALGLTEEAVKRLEPARAALAARAGTPETPPEAPKEEGKTPTKAPPPPLNHSAYRWPKLTEKERALYRSVLIALGEAYLKTGSSKAARDALAEVVPAFPNDREALLLRASTSAALADPAAARADIAAALLPLPNDPTLVLDRGLQAFAQGDLEAARTDLERTIELGEATTTAQARVFLGLVHLRAGRFKAARVVLATAGEHDGLAVWARGLQADLEGDVAKAKGHYAEAKKQLKGEEALLATISLALASQRTGQGDEARALLRETVKGGLKLELASPLLAEVARGRGILQEERVALLGLVASAEAPTADQLYALGRAELALDLRPDAAGRFERALALDANHVSALLGLACARYQDGDFDPARKLFERAKALDATNAYAARGLKSLADAAARRVFVDRFDRASPEVKNGWVDGFQGSFGIEIGLKDGRLVFSGTQARTDMEKTRLDLEVQNLSVVRVEARLDLTGVPAQARAGIRLETERGGAVLFRDTDGVVKWSTSASAGSDYAAPTATIAWPLNGAHLLAVELEDPAQNLVAFYLDANRIGEVKLAAVNQGRKVVFSIYVQAALGTTVRLVGEEARVYVKKPEGSQPPPKPPGGGF